LLPGAHRERQRGTDSEHTIAAAKPALSLEDNLLWATSDAQGTVKFQLASPVWVREGNAKPFWAVLRPATDGFTTRRLDLDEHDLDNRMIRTLHPAHDGGDGRAGGVYAIALAFDGRSTVYEIGVDYTFGGNAKPHQRKCRHDRRGLRA
jgi:hypothetical protein